MPFAVSPGVNVSEIDLTTVVPAVSSTEGAIAGVFHWGPMEQRVLITSEDELVARFGKPTSDNDETFFTAASFLAYANKLYVVRAFDTAARNAVGNSTGVTVSALVVKNEDHFLSNTVQSSISGQTGAHFIAKYPGKLGDALSVSVCGTAAAFESTLTVNATATDGTANTVNVFDSISDTFYSIAIGSSSATFSLKANTISTSGSWTLLQGLTYAADQIRNSLVVGDIVTIGNSTIGTQKLKVAGKTGVTSSTTGANTTVSFTVDFTTPSSLKSNFTSNIVEREWQYRSTVSRAPGISSFQSQLTGPARLIADEVHIVVADRTGAVTGVPGTVLEVFESVSRGRNSKTDDGSTNYYKEILTQQSAWVWPANDMSGLGTALANDMVAATAPVLTFDMAGGVDATNESEIDIVNILNGYDQFKSASQVDVSLILAGKARGGTYDTQLVNYLIDNIAEVRKDCVVFASPGRAAVVDNLNDEVDDIVLFRNNVNSSSYAVLDSGYKYTYDKYNDVYRHVPLNGDVAGLCVRTDSLRDPWWSPAGFNRGQVKNVIKLSYNPSLEAHRDILYQNGINPVVTFPGQGTILYGDKTALNKPSAFNRINVRRLFITLEKAIATAAKFTLFEFNDEFTRSQFRNLVEPFLRDVQGRRGITDFRVVCDTTNNTGEVIDRNEFVGDIYIKPVRSINFIQLNFVAVRTGVEFSEIVGKF